jgi:phosphatidylinositol-bisphosphatase
MASSVRHSGDEHGLSEGTYEYLREPTTSTPHSLSQAVYARRAEYTRPHAIKIKVGTWNCAACPNVEKDIKGWFVDGKGIHKDLVGLNISDGIKEDRSQDHIETVENQEERKSKDNSTIPLHDQGTIIGGDQIGIYALGLQEIVELASAKEYISRVYTDPGPLLRWKEAMQAALPDGYQLVSDQQLSGMLLLIYASSEIFPSISSVSSVSVGTGIMGYLGNKGAVSTRIVLGETTTITFINSHLASGNDRSHLDRRCWDFEQILSRTKFDPVVRAGVVDDVQEVIGDEDFAFWFGDLNFRLEGLPGEDIRRLLMLHTRGEYNAESNSQRKLDKELSQNDDPIVIHHVDSDDDEEGSAGMSTPVKNTGDDELSRVELPDPDDFVQDPHSDPTSLQATLDSLLPHDQLRHVQKAKRAFYDGWREGPITFLPTYKYDVGSMGMFDSSEKKRAPSWCDRILFRTRRDKKEYEEKVHEEELARVKDEEMKARGIDHASDDEDILFDYDPESDGVEGDYDETEDAQETQSDAVITKAGFVDRLRQDVYTSYQRVLSSDHKPIDAVFHLNYDAIVPELKAKIHQEVARELDRAENEGRPGITVVVDHTHTNAHSIRKSSTTSSKEDSQNVDFEEVRFQVRECRGLTIANTGQVAAKFSFVERPGAPDQSDRIAPSWLSVYLSDWDDGEQSTRKVDREIVLEPGDAVNVTLEVYVDDLGFVRSLNEGVVQLEDVLVLSVVDGRDHFITLCGTWMQSCFGRSIDELIRVPEGGVRALLPPRKGKGGGVVNRGEDVRWSAPRELFKLTETVELLTERALADKEMIEGMAFPPSESTGWPFDPDTWIITDKRTRELRRAYVLEALDTDKSLIESFPPEIPAVEKLEVVSEVLLLFLTSLTDGIVTEALWTQLEQEFQSQKQTMRQEDQQAWVLDVLSSAPNHNISFVFLTSMLAKIAGELAPIPKSTSAAASLRSFLDHRRSLSFKGRTTTVQEAAVLRRQSVDRKFSDSFAGALFRGGPAAGREKERKVADDRKREILEVFVSGNNRERI